MISSHRFLLSALIILLAVPAAAFGAGRYNMPTTTSQWLGIGFGAGYHAPLVLERSWKSSAASPGITRTRAPLRMASACDKMSCLEPARPPVLHGWPRCDAPVGPPLAPHAAPIESFPPAFSAPPAPSVTPLPLFDPPAMPEPPEPVSPSDEAAPEPLELPAP